MKNQLNPLLQILHIWPKTSLKNGQCSTKNKIPKSLSKIYALSIQYCRLLFLSKKLGLDTNNTNFRSNNWILQQMLRTYANSEVYRSPWSSTYQEVHSRGHSRPLPIVRRRLTMSTPAALVLLVLAFKVLGMVFVVIEVL